MSSWISYLNVLVHVALLFFIIPIRIDQGPIDLLEEAFRNYLSQFNKTYNNNSEYLLRLDCFKKSLDGIKQLNSNRTNNSAHYGLTKFSDLLPHEFLQVNFTHKHFKRTSQNLTKRSAIDFKEIPRKIDWREKNAVTKIKDQQQCGACWAFTAVETIESMYAIKYGKLEEFSVQQLIDCAGYNNNGCNGGDVCDLLDWMSDYNITLEKETDYPLRLTKGKCKIDSTKGVVAVGDFICENRVDSEDIILILLAKNGPVSVAVNARPWQNYIGGVIKYHCENDLTDLNHAVQIVGYNLEADIPYYIVRNNWGTDFGDGGYLYIAIGHNMCGIATEVSALTIL